MNSRAKIASRAAQQHGLITRSDLVELEVPRGQVRGLIRDGGLVLVGRQTLRVGGAPVTALQRIMAACLDNGGVASHGTAAALHGIADFQLVGRPAVTVDRRSFSYDSPSATLHTSTWLPAEHIVRVDGVPCLNVARTLFSLASLVPSIDLDLVKDAIDSAVAAHLASDPWLWWMLEKIRCRGRNGVATFEELLARRSLGHVTESWLERTFLEVLETAGVEAPVCQARIRARGAFVARVDFAYSPIKVIIEVSGHRWHHTRAQRQQDTRRHRALYCSGTSCSSSPTRTWSNGPRRWSARSWPPSPCAEPPDATRVARCSHRRLRRS